MVEINASDDRTPQAFRTALENSTQMQSVFQTDKRPNCIVLDEIDGAPGPSIDFLLKFAYDSNTKKGKKRELNRPIICICNDPYVASLRLLRQQAFVINVPATETSKLVDRLYQIACSQKIRVDLTTLYALAEKTGNDIRSCLSLLQFFSCKKQQLTLLDVIRSNVGQKDQRKELFSIWTSIFQIQRPTKAQITEFEQESGATLTTMTTPDLRFTHVTQMVYKSNDYEKLMQGVFENYLQQKSSDSHLVAIAEAMEWFSYVDQLQNVVHHTQNYSLYGYFVYAFVAWHFLFATLTWPKITFPSQMYQMKQKFIGNKNILLMLRKNVEVKKRGIGDSPTTMNIDSLPLVTQILNPSIRSVTPDFFTTKEKSDLRDTIEIMVDLGLSFIQLKTSEGNYEFRFEPDLESITKFYENSAPGLSTWAKQLIARNVGIEKTKRNQIKAGNVQGNVIVTKTPRKNQENVPNFLRTLQPKTITSKEKKEIVCKDFFGRITTKTKASTAVAAENNENIVKGKIWYRYKEGFNNAVRKGVTMTELM